VIADEATDLSQKEQLTLCIRWVDNDMEIHEDPVELMSQRLILVHLRMQ